MEEKERLLLELADLKRRRPAHSIKPEYIRQLEDLEERLEALEKKEPEKAKG